MPTIGVADFLALTDSIAAQFNLYELNISADPGGAAQGAQLNEDRILAIADFDVETALLNPFRSSKDQMANGGMARQGWGGSIKGLNVHVSGLDAYCAANPTAIMAPEFKTIADLVLGDNVDKVCVFSPVVNMGTWEPDGAGAGVFTDENAIDNVLYPDAETEAVVLDLAIGAVALGMDVTFATDGGGGPFIVNVVVAALSAIGFVVAITPGTPYSNVTLIAQGAGGDGNATDKVRVRSKRLRPLTL